MKERGPLLGWPESRLAARRIREERERVGLQKAALSKAAGWQPLRVSAIEGGCHRLREEDVAVLAGLLRVPVAYLTGRAA